MKIQLGNIKGLPVPKLEKDEDWFLVPFVAMKGLGLEYARKGHYQGGVLDMSTPEHQELIQRVLAFIEEHEREVERRKAIKEFCKTDYPTPPRGQWQ